LKKPRHDDPTEVILAAARRCYLERGIADTGMREVAVEAGVARSTLYRYFPSRDEVLVAVVMREMIAVNAVIMDRLAGYSEPADIIVEGLILALGEIPRRPILNAVFVSAEDSRARRIVWSSNLIVEFGEQLLEHVIQPALELGLLQERVPPEALTEWVYRILISLLTLPSNWSQSDDDLRTMLHGLLVPVLLR
jgi:TetR/AcrR family transcriptional regulator